ncbi:MAG: hypothetical protein WA309_22980, partial [Pseudolabrys sp.]
MAAAGIAKRIVTATPFVLAVALRLLSRAKRRPKNVSSANISFAHPPKKPANPSPSPSRAADYGHKTAQSVQCPQSIDADQKRGARLITAVETEEGRRWAESRIKSLTGSEKISARFMRQDFFEFLPQFKL